MGEVPDVTVIMAVHNGLPYIERALDSLINQTIGLDRMQVIVVDDGSTDETPAVLDRTAAAHPAFEVIHQANFGRPAGPRNRALRSVRGRYIFFLDQDDYLAPDTLGAAVAMADENGTDVVLARIKGVGGRGTSRTMYVRTVPRTDVFSSSAYWTLNPMKLFRTEMVRSLDLRFDEVSAWGEDEPFVATALIKGAGISILADKDYVFWVFRDDRSNITTSAVALEDRMPVVDRMFDLVAANVPPGADRDRLMRRHFQVELVDSACEGYRTERDPARRAAAFERFRQLVDAYLTERVASALRPRDRVLLRLVSENRPDEFAAYMDALASAERPAVLVEDSGVYLGLPWFRDPGRGLPDALFDVASRLKVVCQFQPFLTGTDGVRLSAICRFGELTDVVTNVALVVKPRDGGGELVVPLAHREVLDETRAFVVVEDTVSVSRLLDGLSGGMHDFYVRIAAGATCRESRLSECAPPPPESRVLTSAAGQGPARSGILSTTAKGNLSVRVIHGPMWKYRAKLTLGRLRRTGRRAAKSLRGN